METEQLRITVWTNGAILSAFRDELEAARKLIGDLRERAPKDEYVVKIGHIFGG